MKTTGELVKVSKWIRGDDCAVHVMVDAVIPIDDPSEPCLEPDVLRHLDRLQVLADAGDLDELAKYGTVYVRRVAAAAR